ncbi:MAG: transcriptional repressor LexA [Chloroflexi bacterium]|nr:MAG: transcriptional repressor LexA [Chloroflexota bacterium]
MSDEKPLSERQKNILAFIREYVQEHTRPPTIREIGRAAKISSTSVVNYNLTKLKERGFLDREAEVSRGLRLTKKAMEIFGETVSGVTEAVSQIMRIPMAGDIVAGEPIESGNDSFGTYDDDDAIELSASMLPGRTDDLFALRVSGDSMIDAMVNDGDIVIMRQQNTARDGEMVAVWLKGDDTTTLKYFFNEGEKIRLQPANPTMEPIFVDANRMDVQGKVMMVLRQTA